MEPGGRVSTRVAVLAGAVLCLGLLGSACQRSERPPIVIGLNPWIGYEYVNLAARQGFFADEGVQVRVVEFGSINDVTRAFLRGEIDVLGCSPVELLVTADKGGRAPKVFQVIDFSDGADVVIARKPIADVAGLRGKRVAIEPGTVTTFLLLRALESAGMTLDDVTLVPADQLQMPEVFTAGGVDAVVTFPPVSSTILAAGQGSTIFSSERVPGEIVDMLATDAALLQERPGDVAAMLRAFDRAIDYVAAHPSEAHPAMAAGLGMKPEEVTALLADGIHVTSLAEQEVLFAPGGPLAKSLQVNADLLRRTGLLSRDIDIDGLIVDEPLRAVLDARRAGKSAPRPEQ
jgi:NitT/TauT family transport system substrate-binding protein